MRFNSYEFVLVFLPLLWLGWRAALHWGARGMALGWLTLGSLFFYAWWDWRFAPLLLVSLGVNFLLGRRLGQPAGRFRKACLIGGLVWNIGLLCYFKYWGFFIENINVVTGSALPLARIVLPLGISFFTFQKIAFLVDAWRGKVQAVRFHEFALFVLFFPQLIAGPIVHHGDFIPQLRDPAWGRLDYRKLALGLSLFAAGLFQKCVVADTLAPLADSAFGAAANGAHLRLIEAWVALAGYTLQLFYDFSGYSHMALGLALLFGLKLPVNFLAPYTAGSLIEFWRRWHMTLSAFLRDYIYIPLGGSRRGGTAHYTNLFITMLIAGIWHGAGWTFVLWGIWHGAALCVNHLWRSRTRALSPRPRPRETSRWAQGLTCLIVMLGWVLFRSPDLATARSFGESLIGVHGISVPIGWASWVQSLAPVVRPRGLWPAVAVTPTAIVLLLVAGWLALKGPRLLRFFGATPEDVTPGPSWQAQELAPAGSGLKVGRAVLAGAMLALALAMLSRSSVFLYFQF